jgi:hypothetical protein
MTPKAPSVMTKTLMIIAIPGDIALPGGFGVRVITTSDAELWDAEITWEELPNVERPVIVVCPDTAVAMNSGISSTLATLLAPDGIEAWNCASAGDVVSRLVAACAGP